METTQKLSRRVFPDRPQGNNTGGADAPVTTVPDDLCTFFAPYCTLPLGSWVMVSMGIWRAPPPALEPDRAWSTIGSAFPSNLNAGMARYSWVPPQKSFSFSMAIHRAQQLDNPNASGGPIAGYSESSL